MGTIEVRLYGDLHRRAAEPVLRLSVTEGETVAEVLRRVGVDPEEVGHIFLNHRLLFTHSSMAPWLRYQVETERVPAGRHWDTPLRPGDQLGVFPRRMGMLVV